MSASIRSVNFEQHASITGTLTNRQIDAYVLQGRYGRQRQLDLLDAIRHRRFTDLDARIKKGEFGQEAQTALKQRRRRTKSGYGKELGGNFLSAEQLETLKAIGLDISDLCK